VYHSVLGYSTTQVLRSCARPVEEYAEKCKSEKGTYLQFIAANCSESPCVRQVYARRGLTDNFIASHAARIVHC
jgi:hypothetical protein